MSGDPFAPLAGATAARPVTARGDHRPAWVPILPVPDEAPPAPRAHPKLGAPVATWRYTDAAGGTLGFVHRFDTADGKVFRPVILARPESGGAPAWRWGSWPAPRPLYGLQALAERSSAPVVVTEGEKACDAADELLPGFVAVTSPNGSKSATKADWSPLRDRRVVVWPDADAVGADYAQAVAALVRDAGAAEVLVVPPPVGVVEGWDAADALAEGWTEAQAVNLVAAAVPVGHISATGAAANANPNHCGGGTTGTEVRRRPPQRDTLIAQAEACELWHDAGGAGYVTFPDKGHTESWPLRSARWKQWLSLRFYEATGGAIGSQAIEDGLRILEARAVSEAAEYVPFIRVGRAGASLFLDLADARWRAVEITAAGWRVVDRPPVKLLRSPAIRPLPEPEGGYEIGDLRRFLNVKTDDDFTLVVAWLVAALRDRGPYPILVINGEQGTGKSMFSRMLRALVDPAAAPIRATPKDDRDLVVSAGNSHVLAFDNLSSVPAWLADAFCRIATGGGFATRTLNTDRDETIFEAQRPLILNGIPLLTDRADLADRAVTVHLAPIAEDQRRPEDEILAEFEAARPRILGALLDAVSAAVRHLPDVKLDRSPRMADFAKWVTAAEAGLGWPEGTFLAAYGENRRDVTESAFEADVVAVAIRDFVTAEHPDGWEGTSTDLLGLLNGRVSEGIRRTKSWPQTAQGLGNRIDRVAPLLRSRGFSIERKHSTIRTTIIIPPRSAR